ncbi:MAG TPA: iron-containing redox enzyme family protein [Methylophilaceae bacterium]
MSLVNRVDHRYGIPGNMASHQAATFTPALSKPLYLTLTRDHFTPKDRLSSQLYLNEKLQAVANMASPLPRNIADIALWLEQANTETGKQYQKYLSERERGAPRRLFHTKSHALNFLQSVAPTKLVDGAWLYGLCRLWREHRYTHLIDTYLEELGEGDATKNHVLLYKKLLAEHECDQWQNLPDEYFVQGAIQLSLGYNAANYIPETIGFNLGYEQLPLHLLITSHELKELGINPYYFLLHVTVDNAATGHARKARQALTEAMPTMADTPDFMRRVNNGYQLNDLGLGTEKIISLFDLDREFLAILKAKSVFGQHMHSSKCRFNGKTLNDWLSDSSRMPEFINSLIENGWIKRHQDPRLSRFWKLIEGDGARMFGVFNGYEKQVIYDWIAGERHEELRLLSQPKVSYLTSHISQLPPAATHAAVHSEDADVAALEKQLMATNNLDEVMQLLIPAISPALHHSPAGLLATQLYKSQLHKTHIPQGMTGARFH